MRYFHIFSRLPEEVIYHILKYLVDVEVVWHFLMFRKTHEIAKSIIYSHIVLVNSSSSKYIKLDDAPEKEDSYCPPCTNETTTEKQNIHIAKNRFEFKAAVLSNSINVVKSLAVNCHIKVEEVNAMMSAFPSFF